MKCEITEAQIIAIYALGQCARTALEKSGVGGSTEQRNNWWKAIGICDKMLSELGYPGHTQILALTKDHWE